MPHDANGNPLKEGDKVFMQGTITSILPSEDYCNCAVELDLPMPPDNTKTVVSSINCKQVYLSPVQAGHVGTSDDTSN